jgi:zinc transporter ZupT
MTILQYTLLFLTSLAGGSAAFFFKKIPRAQLKNVLAFSGAYILGIVVLHLLGDVYQANAATAGRWILLGFVLQLLLDFLSKGIEHGHVHPTDEPGRIFLLQIMLGLCLHAFFEGLPLGGHSTFHAHDLAENGHSDGPGGLLLGIILHETPASFTLASLLILSNFSKRTIWICLFFKASMAPLGALLGHNLMLSTASMTALTAVVIGLFLHISTTILFEADSSSHHHLAWSRLAAIATGLGLAWATIGG